MQQYKVLAIFTLLGCILAISIGTYLILTAVNEEIVVNVEVDEIHFDEISSQHFHHQPQHQQRMNNSTQHQNRNNYNGHLGTNHNQKTHSQNHHHYVAHNSNSSHSLKNHNNSNQNNPIASMNSQNGHTAVKQVQILKPPNRNLVVVDTSKQLQNGGGSTADGSSSDDKKSFNRKQEQQQHHHHHHHHQQQQKQNSNEIHQGDVESESAINKNVIINSNNNSSATTEDSEELSGESMKLISEDAITEKCSKLTLTNDKTKTPMCLVNELARCNHISHQYRLTDERGPPHKKIFTVTLQLGEESYTAEGASIKKAQHLAAAQAMKSTKYPPPVEKTHRNLHSNRGDRYGSSTVTPMVELNALAMKRNELFNVSYQYPKSHHSAENGSNYYHNRHHYSRFNSGRNQQFHRNISKASPDDPFKSIISFEDRQYIGFGLTAVQAKQDAATRALVEMRESENVNTETPTSAEQVPDRSGNNISQQSTDSADSSTGDELASAKSAISLVYELANKRELSTKFEVSDENGPAHMKRFKIICAVSGENINIVTTGEGNSKKTAKKSAAEKMLVELHKLPPLPMRQIRPPLSNGHPHNHLMKRNIRSVAVSLNPPPKRRSRNLIKEIVPTDGSSEGSTIEDESTNPISRLIRIQQSRKQREPSYTVIEERGQQRRKEFVIEVDASGEKASGVGHSKKQAKRIAAENLLIKMGQLKENDATEQLKWMSANNAASEKARKVTFKEPEIRTLPVAQPAVTQNVGGTAGRQLVPGVLLMKSQDGKSFKTPPQSGINHRTTATIAKELLNAGTSPTAEAIVQQSSPIKETTSIANSLSTPPSSVPNSPEQQSSSSSSLNTTGNSSISNSSSGGGSMGIRPTSQLMYLADLLKFEVQFNDFPKGLHNDFLTLVSLNTDPPQIFHGSGNSPDASKDQAAMSALQALSELGLDNVKKSKHQQQAQPTQPLKPILSNGLNKANN